MSAICNKVNSYLPLLGYLTVGAVGLATYIDSGMPVALMAIGAAGYAVKKFFQKEEPVVRPPQERRLSEKVILLPTEGRLAEIQNQKASCFCTTVLWAFFANNRSALDGLPSAILREWNLLAPASDEDVELHQILQIRGAITLKKLRELRQLLQLREKEGRLNGQLNKMLSLLELHKMVRMTLKQKPNVSAAAMRKIAARVNGSFRDTGSQFGDADEIFRILGALIFEDSPDQQTLTDRLGRKENNWGAIPLCLEEGLTLSDLFVSQYEGAEFDRPPEFIAFTVKRNDVVVEERKFSPNEFDYVSIDLLNPINPNEEFCLNRPFFKNGAAARYALTGIVRRIKRDGIPHYDAFWKGKSGQWYQGDDLGVSGNGATVKRVSKNFTFREVKSGYLFFYQKM